MRQKVRISKNGSVFPVINAENFALTRDLTFSSDFIRIKTNDIEFALPANCAGGKIQVRHGYAHIYSEQLHAYPGSAAVSRRVSNNYDIFFTDEKSPWLGVNRRRSEPGAFQHLKKCFILRNQRCFPERPKSYLIQSLSFSPHLSK